MPPVQSKMKYSQKYRLEWETDPTFKDWIRRFDGDNSRARCSYCHIDFGAHKNTLNTKILQHITYMIGKMHYFSLRLVEKDHDYLATL